ncbi:amidase [uncultured Halopseudomonas sp.]|jgi:aspartyl-tRNA(Asn)/glutamyl-tRNA(Gln) amidotransferase subunit A|uniref:amidase n=1 Tax=uncultured Halopseudomonas sp. TaxID=2901193 RepID=UPI0030EF2D35|tara:strand:- start:3887 stop:5296 length:1410 start_codon:yes stop_codon:yes gene_type:complete
MSNEILRMTAVELLQQYRDKTLSPVDVASAMLDQIERLDKHTNGFCLVDRETSLGLARESEQRYQKGEAQGLVDGVPVAVKDVFLTPMWPTIKGSYTVDPQSTLNKSAPATAALARHGYVPIGKTTTPEFGWKGVTDNPVDGVTNNPWNPEKTAGGSSGGSGVAVALGMAPLALGTDAGGSIRIPAGFCGIVGLKPSFGEVPHWPASPFGTLAHAGPMTWTVEDAALMMNVLCEPDHRDTNAIPRRNIDYLANLNKGVKGLKIAYSPNLGYVDVNPEVEAAVAQAAKVFEELGAEVVRVDPGFSDPLGAFGHLFYGGAANAMRDLGAKKRERMDPELVKVAEKAARLSMLDYMGAVNESMALRERMANFHRKYDLLLTPSLPITAFETGREVPRDWPSTRWPTWTPFTYPFNMTGQPGLSVPCGFDKAGLPISLQLVGARFNDALLLQAGHAYQQAAPLTDRRPELFNS